MKKILLLTVFGIIGSIAILRNLSSKKESLHFLEKETDGVNQDDKNFGAFPPEIPEHQFDALFI